MKREAFILVIAVLLLPLFARPDSLAQSQNVITTTLCTIVQNPKTFDRKLVQFRAEYFGDGIEHVILIDPST